MDDAYVDPAPAEESAPVPAAVRSRPEVLMTAAGVARLREELDHLKSVRRQEITGEIRRALDENSDLLDNVAYQDARTEQALLERRILLLDDRLANARVADPSTADGVVAVGSRVTLRDLDTGGTTRYEVVGETETDGDSAKVSAASPVGGAILGRYQGETVEVELPRGTARLLVVAADA